MHSHQPNKQMFSRQQAVLLAYQDTEVDLDLASLQAQSTIHHKSSQSCTKLIYKTFKQQTDFHFSFQLSINWKNSS